MGTLPFDLEINDISALADIIKEKGLGEIRLEDDDIGAKIVIKGRPCPPPPMQMQPMPMMMPQTAQPPAEEKSALAQTPKMPEGNVIKAPVVGTYYSSPLPDKPPFVTVGQHVKKGDIVMIIESMKIMNEIPSAFEGEVKKILVESGQSVEYDQPIIIIG